VSDCSIPLVLWHCWLGIRKSTWPVKIKWSSSGVVICLERDANVFHIVLLMPLHANVSCLIEIQNGSTFLVLAYPDNHGKRPLNACCWQIVLFNLCPSLCITHTLKCSLQFHHLAKHSASQRWRQQCQCYSWCIISQSAALVMATKCTHTIIKKTNKNTTQKDTQEIP